MNSSCCSLQFDLGTGGGEILVVEEVVLVVADLIAKSLRVRTGLVDPSSESFRCTFESKGFLLF